MAQHHQLKGLPTMPTDPSRISLARQRADVERVRDLDALIAQMTDERKSLASALRKRLEDAGATTGFIGKEVVATLSTTTRQQLDAKTFKAEQPEMHRKYCHTIPVTSFRIEAAP